MPHLVRGQVQCIIQILGSHLKDLQVWESELGGLPPCDRSSSEQPHSSPHGGAAHRCSLNLCQDVFKFFSFLFELWLQLGLLGSLKAVLACPVFLSTFALSKNAVSVSKRQDYKRDTSLTSNKDRGKFCENFVPVETPLHVQCSQEAANLLNFCPMLTFQNLKLEKKL